MLAKALQIASANAGPSPVGGLLVFTTSTINRGNNLNTDFDATATASSFYYDWVVPSRVTSISAVAVGGGAGGSGSDGVLGGAGGGGGALSYSNNVAVVPGETLRVYVGRGGLRFTVGSFGPAAFPSGIVRVSDSSVLLKAIGGVGASSSGSVGDGGPAASGVGQVRFSGGIGGTQGSGTGAGGGGASGYSANGNTGLGGSGNFGGNGNQSGLGGGGVGLFGEGASGTALGQGGSGGGDGGTLGNQGGPGGLYGGGGGGSSDETSGGTEFHGGQGAGGAVRIIWGSDRSFPATKTSFADSEGNEITIERN
jgi:hypothetical protein